jgi:hypothetical protein
MPAAPLAAVLSGASRTLLLTVGAAAQHALHHTAALSSSSSSSSSASASSSISKQANASLTHESAAKLSESQSVSGGIGCFDARLGDTLLAVLRVLFDARLALVFRPDFETILAFALQALSAWSLGAASSSSSSASAVSSAAASAPSSTASTPPALDVALLIRNHAALVATLARMSAVSATAALEAEVGAARSQIGALGFFFRMAAVALDAFSRTAPAQPNQRRVFETVVAKLLPIALRWRAHASQCRSSLAHYQQRQRLAELSSHRLNSFASFAAAVHAAPEFWSLVGDTIGHAAKFTASLDGALAATLFHADHMIDTGLPWLPPAPASAAASPSASETESGKKSAATAAAAAKDNKVTISDHGDNAAASDAVSSSSASAIAHDGVYQRQLFAQLHAIAAAASATDATFAAHITEVL